MHVCAKLLRVYQLFGEQRIPHAVLLSTSQCCLIGCVYRKVQLGNAAQNATDDDALVHVSISA